jgi:hypothetical protein
MKHYLNRIAFVVTPFAVAYAMMYLIGSFCSATFELSAWTNELRALMSIFGFVFGTSLYARLEHDHK